VDKTLRKVAESTRWHIYGGIMSKPTVIIWGAGKIGRGPIADMFQSANWHLVFVRRSTDFVCQMREAGSYRIVRTEAGKPQETIAVTDYEAYSTDEVDALARAVVKADLMVVPVMAPQLEQAAEQIAPALLGRRAEWPDAALDILPCANMVSSAEHFLGALRRAMPEALDYLDDKIGIVEALIRVGATDPPEDVLAKDPTVVWTSGPGTLHVDRDAFKGGVPDVPGLILVQDPASGSATWRTGCWPTAAGCRVTSTSLTAPTTRW
jgi:mannitol-1-phosphate 5-dehydrogenase